MDMIDQVLTEEPLPGENDNLDDAVVEILYSPGLRCWVATYDSWMATRNFRLTSLKDLCDLLNWAYDVPVVVEGTLGLEGLPTFGGPEPKGDPWSWDSYFVLVFKPPSPNGTYGKWIMVPRTVWTGQLD